MRKGKIFSLLILIILLFIQVIAVAANGFSGSQPDKAKSNAADVASSTAVIANATPGYAIDWWTVASGGGISSNDGYAVNGTAGQSAAGVLTGDQYTLKGGFWPGQPATQYIFLPLLHK